LRVPFSAENTYPRAFIIGGHERLSGRTAPMLLMDGPTDHRLGDLCLAI
jgi:hypothetical protein